MTTVTVYGEEITVQGDEYCISIVDPTKDYTSWSNSEIADHVNSELSDLDIDDSVTTSDI